jgi:hypothetical protein
VLVHRFSTKEIPAEYIITLLIKALEEHDRMGSASFLMRRTFSISVLTRTPEKHY